VIDLRAPAGPRWRAVAVWRVAGPPRCRSSAPRRRPDGRRAGRRGLASRRRSGGREACRRRWAGRVRRPRPSRPRTAGIRTPESQARQRSAPVRVPAAGAYRRMRASTASSRASRTARGCAPTRRSRRCPCPGPAGPRGPPEPASRRLDDPAGTGEDHREQQPAEDQTMGEREAVRDVLEGHEDGGAHDRPEEPLRPPDDRGDDELGGKKPAELLGRDLAVELSVEAPRQARDRPREDEGPPAVGPHRDADEGGTDVVVPDRAERHPERGAADPPERAERQEEGHQDDVVEGRDEPLGRGVRPEDGESRDVEAPVADVEEP
jgi:hypothetical protein